MDTITVQAKIDGVWQQVDPLRYGTDTGSILGAMNGEDAIIKWAEDGGEVWYYVGTDALAKSQRLKTKYVLTITELIGLYYHKGRVA